MTFPDDLAAELLALLRCGSAEYLPPKDAAVYLQIARGTLTDWRRRGVGPPWILASPKHVRYARRDLDKWMAERRVVGTNGKWGAA